MRRINVNIFPASGSRSFIETDGTRIVGPSWPGVVKAVTSYRARNKLPAGNPTEEVRAQVCAREPGICHEVAPPGAPPRPPSQSVPASGEAQVRAKALSWLTSMRRHVGETGHQLGKVSNSEAARRASICRGCPMNKLFARGCSTCADVIADLRKRLASDKNFDPALGGCQALGCDLKLAVFLDEPPVSNGSLPERCWRKP